MGEFFRVKASTAQALVKEIGPFYRERDGTSLVDFEFKLSTLIGKSMMVLHIVVGRGRPQVHLQEQILMLLHFVAHKGKYGLLSDKFGITRSCYFTCIEEMMAIVTQDLLGKHIFWPNSDRQKEMCDYYKQRYGFLGVIGAIDGTHVTISKPPGMQFLKITSVCERKCTQCCCRCAQCRRTKFWTLGSGVAKILDPPTTVFTVFDKFPHCCGCSYP